jgi:hypothetical protein
VSWPQTTGFARRRVSRWRGNDTMELPEKTELWREIWNAKEIKKKASQNQANWADIGRLFVQLGGLIAVCSLLTWLFN